MGRQPSILGLFHDNFHFSKNVSSPPIWDLPYCPLNLALRRCFLASGEGGRASLPLTPQLFPGAEKDWTEDDRGREKVLMQEIVTLIEQRNAIVNCLDEDRQR